MHPYNPYNALHYNPKNYYLNNNSNINQEKLDIECICEKQSYYSKNNLKQCILCHKYQHIE